LEAGFLPSTIARAAHTWSCSATIFGVAVFHADAQILGKTIHLDSEGYEVVAVTPKGLQFFAQAWNRRASANRSDAILGPFAH
jgi:hypothetical protein